MAFRELRTHFPSKKWPLSGGALCAQFISILAARYARKEWVGGRGPARYARTYFVIEAERQFVRDVFSLEEVPPSLISPLVPGTEPVYTPWTQALECTRRA